MKSNDLVSLLAGGILAFVAWKILAPKLTGTSSSSYPTKINVGNTSGTVADGWQYFSDGTAIAPNGDYYYQGTLQWKANP